MTENNKVKKKQGKERTKSAQAWRNIYRRLVVAVLATALQSPA